MQVRSEMKSSPLARPCAALLMAFVLLASPVAVLAKKGEKNYKRGLEYEQAQQWEKAAQEMDRMLRLQREKEGTNAPRNQQTSYRGPAGTVPVPAAADGQADGTGAAG